MLKFSEFGIDNWLFLCPFGDVAEWSSLSWHGSGISSWSIWSLIWRSMLQNILYPVFLGSHIKLQFCGIILMNWRSREHLSFLFDYPRQWPGFYVWNSVPEIEQGLSGAANTKITVSFTPHLMPMVLTAPIYIHRFLIFQFSLCLERTTLYYVFF